MIKSITVNTAWHGRAGGTTWFHLRACMVPHPDGPRCLMTLQSITGSDIFGPVHWTESTDLGKTWTPPAPVPEMGRIDLPESLQEGVCDTVPEYHAPTRSVLAIGHNVYYSGKSLVRPDRTRYPVYTVRNARGEWSGRHKLAWIDEHEPQGIYTCGCAQRTTFADGRVLVPLSVGLTPGAARTVCTVACRFDGTKLEMVEMGNTLARPVGRGLLEPSLASLGGRHFLTMRAEDGHGYVTTSDDGLKWAEIRPWSWDDDEPLVMSSTQQRWVTHSDGLFLVYTRRSETNAKVVRWRAPLYIAQVDMASLRLIRASEQVAVPLVGDGIHDPTRVAHLGNFHTVNVSPLESWVTVGEVIPSSYRGDGLISRIAWSKPNRLVEGAE